jgi:hypothetical protein
MGSCQPEVYFNRDWHHSGNRFASEEEAWAFVRNLRATWNPPGFVRDMQVLQVKEPANARLGVDNQAVPLAGGLVVGGDE